jgi:uncharacterized protein
LSKTYPDEKECISMLKAAGCSRRVIIHCRTVCAVADAIASSIPEADPHLVSAGALLHDIGRSADHSMTHAIVGAGIAEKMGVPPEVCEIIKRHTGAGLDEDDIREFMLPPGDYMPRTIEQKIVCQADNMVSDSRVISHRRSEDRLRGRGFAAGADRIAALHSELSEKAGYDLDLVINKVGEFPVGETRRGRGKF